jgi:hypothetical protein
LGDGIIPNKKIYITKVQMKLNKGIFKFIPTICEWMRKTNGMDGLFYDLFEIGELGERDAS